MVTIGSAQADPGEAATGWLEVGESRIGRPIALPVAVYEGATGGQTLYIQAASDGDELNGVGVIREVAQQLDADALTGRVVMVGVVNVDAFHQQVHRNPIDDMKLNRTYPGSTEGSASERIAAATFELATEADLILDLHQGSTSQMIDEVRVRCGRRHRLHESCLELARTFDTGYIFDQQGPRGQLARVAPDEGIPAIDPELGGAVGWDAASIRTGVRGVMNVLRGYGFLDGDIEVGPQRRARRFDQYGAPVGGLVSFEAGLGQAVEAGDVLFGVTDVFGAARAGVTAESAGIFWRANRRPQVASGEYVCSVGTGVDTV